MWKVRIVLGFPHIGFDFGAASISNLRRERERVQMRPDTDERMQSPHAGAHFLRCPARTIRCPADSASAVSPRSVRRYSRRRGRPASAACGSSQRLVSIPMASSRPRALYSVPWAISRFLSSPSARNVASANPWNSRRSRRAAAQISISSGRSVPGFRFTGGSISIYMLIGQAPDGYSSRSASIGAMRDARSAGSNDAASTVARDMAAAISSVRGSLGAMP
jgi:hypothetical protein